MELIKDPDFRICYEDGKLLPYWHTISRSTDGSTPVVDRNMLWGNLMPALQLGRDACVEQRFYDFYGAPAEAWLIPVFYAAMGNVYIALTSEDWGNNRHLDALVITVVYLDGSEYDHSFAQQLHEPGRDQGFYYSYSFPVRPDKPVQGIRIRIKPTLESVMETPETCYVHLLSMEGYKSMGLGGLRLPLLWEDYWKPLLVGFTVVLFIGVCFIWLTR